MLLTDGRHTPADLLKGKVHRRLERSLSKALAEHPLRAAACRELLERCNATSSQLQGRDPAQSAVPVVPHAATEGQ